MDNNVRANLAELVGTFLFVFFTAGMACAIHLTGEPRLDVMGVALASGAALAVALTASSHVSQGCLNPAIALTLWVYKRLDGRRMLTLVAMQLLGALLAGLVLRFSFNENVLRLAQAGAPHVTDAFRVDHVVTVKGYLSGLGVEVILTCLLTLAVFATLFDPRSPKMGGLGAGLAQVAVVLFGYRLTGGSANPARWFGTIVWEMTLQKDGALADHAAFWAGPILGALLAGLLYTAVFQPAEKR
jgi:glycerol uptake facilitator-like aquaporin